MEALLKAIKPFDEPAKPFSVTPDGKGGAFYHYNIDGDVHSVHSKRNPFYKGDEDSMAHDHSSATSRGMNLNQMGSRMGSLWSKINDATEGTRNPKDVHIDEADLKHLRNAYHALKTHHSLYGDHKPYEYISDKDQLKYMDPIVNKATDSLQAIRSNNRHLHPRDRAVVMTKMLGHVQDNMNKVIRSVTQNPDLHFDYHNGRIVKGGLANPIPKKDFQRLKDAGFFEHAHDWLHKFGEGMGRKLSDDEVQGAVREWRGNQGHPTTQSSVGQDWHHDDYDRAKHNFVQGIGSHIGDIYTKARDAMTQQGAQDDVAHSLAAHHVGQLSHGISKKMSGVTGEGTNLSVTHFDDTGMPRVNLNLPTDQAHHGGLMKLNDTRQSVENTLSDHSKQFGGGTNEPA